MVLVPMPEAARRLGYHPKSVRRALEAQGVPLHRIGRVWYVREEDLAHAEHRPAHRPPAPVLVVEHEDGRTRATSLRRQAMTRFDWSQWVGDMISPADEVREAREAGRTLAEQAELLTHLVAELWGGEAAVPDTLRDDILAALEAAAKEIDDDSEARRQDAIRQVQAICDDAVANQEAILARAEAADKPVFDVAAGEWISVAEARRRREGTHAST